MDIFSSGTVATEAMDSGNLATIQSTSSVAAPAAVSTASTSNTGSLFMSGMSAIGSSISAYSQYKSGQSQQAAYNYNAAIDTENMQEQLSSSDAKYQKLIGKQRTLYAAAGVDIASGSPLLTAAATAYTGAEEASYIEASGTEKANLEKYYGQQASDAGTTSAFSTFLTGLSKASSTYTQAMKGAYTPTVT
jgi:hypothetical protein